MSPAFESPPRRLLTLEALEAHRALLPSTADELIRHVGLEPALTLMNTWPGVRVRVPKHVAANEAGQRQWARLAEMVGEHAMPALCAHWGGQHLDVPVCAELLDELRNDWVRRRFDALTTCEGAGRLSAYGATGQICIELAEAAQPLTFRQVQLCINRPAQTVSRSAAPNAAQLEMFAAVDEMTR